MNSKYKYTDLFFSTTPCLASHVYTLLNDASNYLKELKFICESGTFEVTSPAVRARILAALHITSKHKQLTWFLTKCNGAEVAKALSLLDRNRKLRQLKQKIQKIESEHPELVNPSEEKMKSLSKQIPKRRRKIDVYRQLSKSIQAELTEPLDKFYPEAHNDSAVVELIQSSSVSGALARKVRAWAKTNLDEEELDLIMLGLPKDPWLTLADLVHFHPKDFSASNFLFDIFRTEEEKGDSDKDMEVIEPTFVSQVRDMIALQGSDLSKAFFRVANDFPQMYKSYSYIRTQPSLMACEDVVADLAQNIPLDTALWYFEELYNVTSQCEGIIAQRISGHKYSDNLFNSSKLTYGKLVERVLTFRKMDLSFADDLIPVATSRLGALNEYWKGEDSSKVAVFGDASSSMQLAIEASTVFASMVSSCFSAELSFFASGLIKSPHEKPSTVNETLNVCSKIRASGCTSLAAALWPYYSKKIVMDTFVLVTDEEENTSCNGFRFAPLLAEYKKHVNENVNLIVVRVGRGYPPFQSSLESHGINYRVVGIDSTRPDLAKFDALLGQLHMISSQKHNEDDVIVEDEEAKTSEDSMDFVVV